MITLQEYITYINNKRKEEILQNKFVIRRSYIKYVSTEKIKKVKNVISNKDTHTFICRDNIYNYFLYNSPNHGLMYILLDLDNRPLNYVPVTTETIYNEIYNDNI